MGKIAVMRLVALLLAGGLAASLFVGTIAKSQPAAQPPPDNSKFTAGTLFDFCVSDTDGYMAIGCKAYISGFVGALQQSRGEETGVRSEAVCLPQYFAPMEAEAVFVRRARLLKAESESASADQKSRERWEDFRNTEPELALYVVLGVEYPCGPSDSKPPS